MKNIFVFLLLMSTLLKAQNSDTLIYDFSMVTTSTGKTDPTAPPAHNYITFLPFTAHGTPNNPNAGGRFSFTGWSTGATNGNNNYTALTGIVDTSEYYEFSIEPKKGYVITIHSLELTFQRSGTGVRTFSLRCSQDSFKMNLEPAVSNLNFSKENNNIVFLNNDNITSAQTGIVFYPGINKTKNKITFRFYGWNSESSAGSFSIDDVAVNFTADPIINIQALIPSACVGDTLSFINKSVINYGSLQSATWNFSNGLSTTDLNPELIFDSCGLYSVQLIVTNNFGDSAIANNSFDVHCLPENGFLLSDSVICENDSIKITNTTIVNNATISKTYWEITPAITFDSTHTNPAFCIKQNGIFGIQQTTISNKGCSTKTLKDSILLVNAIPNSGFLAVQNGMQFQLQPDSAYDSTFVYQWFVNGVLSDSIYSPLITFSNTGLFTICLRVKNNSSCSDSTCNNLLINNTSNGTYSIPPKYYLFPNPTSQQVFIKSEINSIEPIHVSIFSSEGILIKEFISDENVFLLTDIADGLYWVKLTTGERCNTQPLVIIK